MGIDLYAEVEHAKFLDEVEIKAKEILEYCFQYLKNPKDLQEFEEFKKTQLYKEMIEEIVFLLDTD